MLYALEIENFMSIREPQVIDLRVAPNVRDQSEGLRPIWSGSSYRAPLVVGFFGANGAGKSNVLRAMSFISDFASKSFSWAPDAAFRFSKFAGKDAAKAPTRLTVHFAGPKTLPTSPDAMPDEYLEECSYTYEIEIESVDPPVIRREALSYHPKGAKKRIFERVAGERPTAGEAFGLTSDYRVIDNILRPNASVISTLVQLNHPASIVLNAFFSEANIVSNIGEHRFEPTDDMAVRWYSSFEPALAALKDDISRLDIGITDAKLAERNGAQTLQFEHRGLNKPIPLCYESHGTRQFIRIYPHILLALRRGGIAIIDELDTCIHPVILEEIMSWFYDPAKNPRRSQLWMTCQAASMLEVLSKEQIFFCEKDGRGRSSVFALRDIKNVRRIDNFYKKYLGGAYGAVPKVG